MTAIGADAFRDCPNLTIYCVSGSAAQRYAEENGINHEFFDGHIHHFSEWVIEKEASYNEDGFRYRVCSCGLREEEVIPKLEINWDENEDYAMVILQVNDNETQTGLENVKITFVSGETSYETYTDEAGQLTYILPKGPYEITVEAAGYQVRNLLYTLEAGEQEFPVINLTRDSFVSGSLEVTEMTKEEMEEAGIDLDDPDNQHVYKYAIKLEFEEALKEYDITAVTMKNTAGEIVFQGFQIGGGAAGSVLERDKTYKFTAENDETVSISLISERLILVIYGEAHWLKEMFRAELLVVNTSASDTMENCTAEIILPEGMSLAAMETGEQDATQLIEEIAPGGQEKLTWYLRGDEEGEYPVSVELIGTLQPFEERFSYEFTTEDPVRVYAGSALHMTVTVPEAAYYEQMYNIHISLENVSDKDLYRVSNEITDIEQYVEKRYRVHANGESSEVVEKEWLSVEHLEDGSGRVYAEVLHPGDSLEIELSTRILWKSNLVQMKENAALAKDLMKLIPPTGPASMSFAAFGQLLKMVSYLDVQYRLVDYSIITMEGSTTTIPTDFVVQEEPVTTLEDKIADVLLSEITGKLSQDKKIKVSKTILSILKDDVDSAMVGEDLSENDREQLEKALGLVIPYSTLKDFVVDLVPFTQSVIKVAVLRDGQTTDDVSLSCVKKTWNTASPLSRNAETEPIQQEDGSWLVDGDAEVTLNAKVPGSYTLRLEADGVVQEVPLEFYDGTLMNAAPQDPNYIYMPEGQELEAGYLSLLEMFDYTIYNTAGEEARAGEMLTTGYRIVDEDMNLSQTIIVRGDVNGDGLIDEKDVAAMEAGNLNEIQQEAANLTEEGAEETSQEVLQEYIENQQSQDPEPEDPEEETPDEGKDPEEETPGTEEPGVDEPETDEPEEEKPGTDDPGEEKPGTETPDPENPDPETPDQGDSDEDQGNQGETDQPAGENKPSGGTSSSNGSFSGSGTGGSSSSSNKLPDNVIRGNWTYRADGFWEFRDYTGRQYVNTWALIENPYADANNGQNPYAWFNFDGEGRMRTGWFYDQTDGCTYYLNPVSDNTLGQMMTGWHWIKGEDGLERCFYFEEVSNGRMGALYQNKMTPDGYAVNESGAWTENGIERTR